MVTRTLVILLLTTFSLTSFAQSADTVFQKQWLEIDTLVVKKDFTKTALEKTALLYKVAKPKNLTAQVIKCLIYEYTLQDRVTTDDPATKFKTIQAELKNSSDEIEKAILYALLAKQYRSYFLNHRYNLYNRRTTTETRKDDPATWSATDFAGMISTSFLRSIENKKLLQATPLNAYTAIILDGNTKNTRPTLYDLLAHEALAYFTTGDIYIPRPVNAFIFNQQEALETIDVFTRSVFKPVDSSATQWTALQIYQQLISFHKNDADKNALLEVNLERLEWAYRQSMAVNKETLYKKSLEEITTLYGHTAASSQAWYLLAQIDFGKAITYQPYGDTSAHYGYASARQIIEKALALYNKESNNGTINLQNLRAQIDQKELRTQAERVNVPGKPFRVLVNYRNVDTMYARIVLLEKIKDFRNTAWMKEDWQKALSILPYRSFSQALPVTKDFQHHSVEIKTDGLPVGEYVLISSSSKDFNQDKDRLNIQFFYITNISYIKNKNDYFVLHRETGKPLTGIKVSILREQYISSLRKRIYDTVATRTTNQNGYFSFVPNFSGSNYRYAFSGGNDHFYPEENDYNYIDPSQEPETNNETIEKAYEKASNRIFFFTDRNIYRPGQQVYFKGIAVTRTYKTKLSKLLNEKDSGWVYLRDANRKLIDSVKFVLNSFGSFTGKFILPQNGLTGSFTIEAPRFNFSNTRFSVEEYKRPKFSVQFEQVKGAYRLNDSVVITGIAKALAGNLVDGAKVSYRITRNIDFLETMNWRRPLPQYGVREIAHGEMRTDTDGKFILRFKAMADDITDRTGNPVLNFNVQADVTDINGETRSTSKNIPVGFSSVLLQLTVPSITEADSLKKIRVSTTNLSYEKEPAKVSLKIYSLQAPQRLIRKRYWERPDQFIYSEKEFVGYFPVDEYDNESDPKTWSTGQLITEASINTANTNELAVPETGLAAGYYKIEGIATDKYGEQTSKTVYCQVFSKKSNSLPVPSYLFMASNNALAEPGNTAHFITGSSAPGLFVIRKTERPRQKNNGYDFSSSTNGLRDISFTPTENDRGGVTISEGYVFENRFYSSAFRLNIPWSNKTLKISYSSYRDKTEPGSEEKWSVTVQGNQTEKVAAELLTGMYDASLDQFGGNNWNIPSVWDYFNGRADFNGYTNFAAEFGRENERVYNNLAQHQPTYDYLATNAAELWDRSLSKWMNDSTLYLSVSLKSSMNALNEVVKVGSRSVTGATSTFGDAPSPPAQNMMIRGTNAKSFNADGNIVAQENYDKVFTTVDFVDAAGNHIVNGRVVNSVSSNGGNGMDMISTRKNFNETAFFFPQLHADSTGSFSFSFTMPEALTQWKWMSFAHTKELAFGMRSTNVVTQKKLMVQPNAPRFLREGDNIEFSSKIVNLSDKEITGQVSLELVDASTNTSVDGWFQNVFPSQYFSIEAGQSFAVKFPIQIPFSYNRPLTWRIKARAGEFSDGEENILPVLTNRQLVTESLPLFLPGDTPVHFSFDKLLKNTSESLTQEALTIEYSSNPVWYAIQALPYLMEYPYECAEQTFNRFYANSLAAWIINKDPKLKKVFEQWKADSSSLQSNLQKNEELKQILLQETPWVFQAESEAQQKKNIALLFDLVKLGSQTDALLEKLAQLQLSDGSFSWFKGGREDRYMTNYILTGIGKLKRLGALSPEMATRIRPILVKALQYMDGKIKDDYNWLVKNKADLAQQQLSPTHISYLYMRSFFRDLAQSSPEAYSYFFKQGKQFWIKQNSYYKAQLGLIYYRNGEEKFATGTILPALFENTITDSKQGLYWKTAYANYWYQSPIEHQSMMISFVGELSKDLNDASLTKKLDAMKTWLLLNKQTSNWRTTIATADACYALLLNGSDWLNTEKKVSIQLGKTTISSSNEKTEAGTGYFKKRIDGKLVTPEMGDITVTTNSKISQSQNIKASSSPSWGSVYWQYFEDLDKITPATSPLSLTKKLFIEKHTDKGVVLLPVNEGDELKTGDKIIVRIELRSDRDMDYLHLKDMRAAAMEPVNVLSGYKWQDGLGYYESTKDVSSNFFIDHLAKGTYVFDYPLFITHAGVFSVGIASIQCMYAPEFTSHSGGIKIRVAN
ncbi:MAG: alpha-2-macroglobulin family protein [Bacteroidota bacterium]